MRPQDAIAYYAAAASRVLAERFAATRCLNGTRICLDVMERLHLQCRPCSVVAFARNAYYECVVERLGRLPTATEMLDVIEAGGWAVVTDIRPMPSDASDNVWPGHLVAIVEGVLVDSAALQFHRPAKGIFVPDIITFEGADRQFRRGRRELTRASVAGTVLSYTARPTDNTYKTGAGYQRSPHNREAVEDILQLMHAAHRQVEAQWVVSPVAKQVAQ